MNSRSLAAVLLLAPAFAAAAHADTLYTYTGSTYTSATLPYTTSESVTGSFSLSSALAANLHNVTIAPTTFSFFDGLQTLTNATAGNYSFGNISTDAAGNLTSFYIQIQNNTAGFIKLGNAGAGLSGDSVRLTAVVSAGNTTAGSFATQTSATALTPEPSSLALLSTGLLGVAGLCRRRLAWRSA